MNKIDKQTNIHTYIHTILICLICILLSVFAFNIYNKFNEKHLSSAVQVQTQSKVGVLVIALGRYNVFWEKLYKSSEKYFLPGHEKHYYVFTDDKDLKFKNNTNVHVIPHKKMGWPYDSMMRYDMFLSQKKQLEKLDYLYFMNINMKFKTIVNEEVLPTEKTDGLVVLTHFSFIDTRNPDKFPYERYSKSTAYIPYGKGYVYAPGGFNGGTSKAFLKLSEACSNYIYTDLKNNIVARWQDESYLNKYILDKHPLILPAYYMWPMDEEYRDDLYYKQAKVLLRDKKDYGGKWWLRGESDIKSTPYTRFKYKILSEFSNNSQKRKKYKQIYKKLQH